MRIIGGHDFYDSGMVSVSSDDIVFVRKSLNIPKEVSISSLYWRDYVKSRGNILALTHENITDCLDIGGFKSCTPFRLIHPTIQSHNITVSHAFFAGVIYRFISDAGKSFVASSYKDLIQCGFTITPRRGMSREIDPKIVDEFFVEKLNGDDLQKFVDARVATAIHVKENMWSCNCDGLGTIFSLQKILHPYEAFQQLEQFVNNFTNPEKEMVEITNEKVLLSKHGFDNWSFKKRSSK